MSILILSLIWIHFKFFKCTTINVFKYHVSCTNGKISVRIKIGITFIFMFYHSPILLVMFVPVGLSSIFCRYCRVVKFLLSPGLGSWPNMTCRRYQQIDERPTGTNTTNWMGRWNLKIKVIPIPEIIQ